ncbi:type VI secretion system baseplate subunit TssG [Celerinatantimonas yamalensis]|uniref:Type VI secretion system baseplate subunit TssG n=1 Tax=Celerinatantimonas yamalensis TaxID=559956 RepID=A0ABW9G5E0_9GAMM
MGNSSGSTAADLEVKSSAVKLPEHVESFNFYQLVELLHRIFGDDPEGLANGVSESLLFSANPSLGFAASDIRSLTSLKSDQYQLQTSFLGLSGAQSPLPGFFLEQIATEGEQGLRKQFLDFFNHRLITLLYQIWRKYRYYVRFRENASDAFSEQLFALVGLADDELRSETQINWCKMLSYAGMLAGRSRSPQVISGIIAHYFDLKQVEIRQWQVRQVPIAPEQKCSLGRANSRLGDDTVIGDSISDCMGKFVICFKDLSFERFQDFLPSGSDYPIFCKLMEFILREQMAFDLELELAFAQAPSFQLSRNNQSSLGWYSFMGDSNANRQVCIHIR